MEHEQVNYYEALKLLAKKYHIEVEERELTDEEKAIRNDRESMFLVNDYAQKYFSNMLHNHIDGKAIAKSYLQERGFREDIIQNFNWDIVWMNRIHSRNQLSARDSIKLI